jgi:hypothetical protein
LPTSPPRWSHSKVTQTTGQRVLRLHDRSVLRYRLRRLLANRVCIEEKHSEVDSSIMSGLSTKLTIVIPTLNRRTLLQRAVRSALGQTVPVQVLVSDNGSTDGTWLALQRLRPERLRLLRQESTISSQAHAKILHDAVATEWAVFLSDDDFLAPSFTEALEGLHHQHPDARILRTGVTFHYFGVEAPSCGGPPIESGSDFLLGFLRGTRQPAWCAMAVRMDDLRRIGAQPDSRQIGDMYYWVRIARAGSVACVNRHLSHYVQARHDTDSTTSGIGVAAWARESEVIAQEIVDAIGDGGVAVSNAELETLRQRFLGRTVANQILWNVTRGRPRAQILRELPQVVRHLRGEPSVVARTMAALALPRPLVRRAVEGFVHLQRIRTSNR